MNWGASPSEIRDWAAEPPVNPMIDAMNQIMDSMRILAEGVDGYRKSCEERGYSPSACEAMAFDLHHQMVTKMFSS